MPQPAPGAIDVPAAELRRLRGDALRGARTAAGLSARKLVERVNSRTRGSDLTTDAIYSYEKGRVLLSREVGERVAAALRVPLGSLLVGDPDFVHNAASGAVAPEPGPMSYPGPGLTPAAPGGGQVAPAGDTAELHVPPTVNPIHLGRVLMVREGLLQRVAAVEQRLSTLLEQARFTLGEHLPIDGLTVPMEMLRRAVQSQLEAPETAWLDRQPPEALHEPLQEVVRLMREVEQTRAKLQAAAHEPETRTVLLERLVEAADQLRDAHGLVERMMPASFSG